MLRHVLPGTGLLLGLGLALGLVIALGACASNDTYGSALLSADAPQPEMERLQRLIGGWTGTAQIVSAPAALAAELPTTESGQPVTMLAGWEASWALRGKFLRQAGWHERAPGVLEHYVEYVGWDDDSGLFRVWFFTDSGEAGQAAWDVSKDGSSISVTAKGRHADGTAYNARGTMTVSEEGSMAWTWSESVPEGRLELRGTGTRRN